jgi:DNA helicase-2/ATP-dependent DNA helicase PcrA
MNPEIILGCPGSGKTTALLDILDEELARSTAPEKIGFVSFTRKAADEAAERACARFGLPRSRFPWARTLHSLAFRRLGMRRDDVLEGRRLQEFGQYAGTKITGRWTDDGTMSGFEPGDRIIFMDNVARVRKVPLRELYNGGDDQLPWREVERVTQALTQFKRERGLMDYTDMLSEFVAADAGVGLDVLFVDEAQDVSAIGWDVVRVLARGCRRVVVAGDDDQILFEWSGADAKQFIELPGTVRVLEQSHRVPRKVQSIAASIIERVHSRRPKTWHARDSAGEVRRAASVHDLDWNDPDTGGPSPPILVLARNSFILREQVVPELRRQGVLYERGGNPSVPPGLLADIAAWERLRAGGAASGAECRDVYRHMSSGARVARGHKELPGVDDREDLKLDDLKKHHGLLTDAIWHEAMDRLPRDDVGYIIKARQRGEKLKARPRVRISTIHSAKGGEADHVILFKEVARRTAREALGQPDPERRVWYVGCTRAKEKLTIVEAQGPEECTWL